MNKNSYIEMKGGLKNKKMEKRQIKEPDFENGDTLFNMFDYFCSRIDFGKSALDNGAIVCMNTLFTELRKQTDKIKVD